jgi:phosphoribosyl-ATP pyrophosphohydrolase
MDNKSGTEVFSINGAGGWIYRVYKKNPGYEVWEDDTFGSNRFMAFRHMLSNAKDFATAQSKNSATISPEPQPTFVTITQGYHLADIKRGEYGKLSKVLEEVYEAIDAETQGCKIMLGVELSDLYGALKAYAKAQGLTMKDLATMSKITSRAFRSGIRKSR